MMRKKSFGQHFLTNVSIAQQIVEAADIQPNEVIVEVGPGEGALTGHLLQKTADRRNFETAPLFLIELDRDLLNNLEEKYPEAEVIHADAAIVDYEKILSKGRPWVLIGNLPYNAGTAIVMHTLQQKYPPYRMVVMLQKEVGDRMMAEAGGMSLLSVAVQMYTVPTRVLNVKPGSFSPPPKVDSVVIRLDRREDVPENAEEIIGLAKAAFAHPRKQMHSVLRDALGIPSEKTKEILKSLGLSEAARPQELSVDEWEMCYNFLHGRSRRTDR